MGRSRDQVAGAIVNTLQDLIRSTKAANFEFATQLLQLAQLDILMSKHGIAAEEIDQLRQALEQRAHSAGEIIEFDRLRRSREARAMPGR